VNVDLAIPLALEATTSSAAQGLQPAMPFCCQNSVMADNIP
jgi:hypothetical protein